MGITPACAGNSRAAYIHLAAARDHPHVCGEQRYSPVFPRFRLGSPPRVRGTEGELLTCTQRIRITPACAGNSYDTSGFPWKLQVHPRVCGEQAGSAPASPACIGSPPRVRGTGTGGGARRPSEGITPACAGNRAREELARKLA